MMSILREVSLATNYSQDFRCCSEPFGRNFDVDERTSYRKQTGSYIWVDPAKPGFIEYCDCVAKSYIHDGVTALLFEVPPLMIPASSDPAAASIKL